MMMARPNAMLTTYVFYPRASRAYLSFCFVGLCIPFKHFRHSGLDMARVRHNDLHRNTGLVGTRAGASSLSNFQFWAFVETRENFS